MSDLHHHFMKSVQCLGRISDLNENFFYELRWILIKNASELIG